MAKAPLPRPPEDRWGSPDADPVQDIKDVLQANFDKGIQHSSMIANPGNVSAIVVTRGNVPMEPILETLPYDEVIVWDNSVAPFDLKVFGRYAAVATAKHDIIYFQDDDVIFRDHETLLDSFNFASFGGMVCNNAHGNNYAGLEDLGYPSVGSLIPKWLVKHTFDRWFSRFPGSIADTGFLYWADAVFGILAPFQHVNLPYERLYEGDEARGHICRMETIALLKYRYAGLARTIRDEREHDR